MSYLGSNTLTFYRPNTKSKVKGKYIDAGFTSVSISVTKYPWSKETLERLKINNIYRAGYTLVSDGTEIQINDEVVIDSKRYKVVDRDVYTDQGFLESYVAYAALIEV